MGPEQRTVLLIDEDPDILKLLEYVLSDEHYSLVARRTPEEALEALTWAKVDCILIDIHFAHTPECFGFLRALRAMPGGSAVPVLATSAMGEREVARHALSLGVRKFIPKPFYPGEILQEIRAVFA